jgi:hypothetical protein
MALHADFSVEFASFVILCTGQLVDCVEIMAVMAGSGIHIAGCNGLAMNGLLVDRFLVMALDAFGNCDAFVIFPVIMDVNIGVALGTGHTFFSMYTGIVLGVLLFVAALALHLLDFDLLFHMFGEIGNVHMATGAGIFAMDRSRE